MPSIPPEIQAEIVALDVQIADLILKSQGNYRALEQLAEILDNCLDSCELNLNSIRIIPDDNPRPSAVSMKDLPLDEKQLIYSCSFTNSLLLNILADTLSVSPEELAKDIAANALAHHTPVTDDQVNDFVNGLLPNARKAKNGYFFKKYDNSHPQAKAAEETS